MFQYVFQNAAPIYVYAAGTSATYKDDATLHPAMMSRLFTTKSKRVYRLPTNLNRLPYKKANRRMNRVLGRIFFSKRKFASFFSSFALVRVGECVRTMVTVCLPNDTNRLSQRPSQKNISTFVLKLENNSGFKINSKIMAFYLPCIFPHRCCYRRRRIDFRLNVFSSFVRYDNAEAIFINNWNLITYRSSVVFRIVDCLPFLATYSYSNVAAWWKFYLSFRANN